MERLHSKWKILRNEGIQQMKSGTKQDIVRNKNIDKSLERNISGWVRGWTNEPTWLNYGINYNGVFLTENCKNCPCTYKLVKELSLERSIVMAGFSWLLPKSGIPPHIDEDVNQCDVFHIGLFVPDSSKCVLITEGGFINEENGKLISFDDDKIHSAFNATDDDRLIFYVKLKNTL